VASTQAELAQFQWLYHADVRRVVVIPPGVDTSRFYPIPADEAREFVGVPPDRSMILFVGRIEPLKGIDTLLQAMAILSRGALRHPLCVAVIGAIGCRPRTDDRGDGSATDTAGALRIVIVTLSAAGSDTLVLLRGDCRGGALSLRILWARGAGGHGLRTTGGGF
jgi:glycosyltransferase involved in cell wall biosynthesis